MTAAQIRAIRLTAWRTNRAHHLTAAQAAANDNVSFGGAA